MDTKTKAWTEMTTEEQLAKAVAEVERLKRMSNARYENEKKEAEIYQDMGRSEILRQFASNRLFEAIENEDKDTVLKIMKSFMHKMHIEACGRDVGEKFIVHSYEDQYDVGSGLCWCANEKAKEVEVIRKGYRSLDGKYEWVETVREIPAIVEIED